MFNIILALTAGILIGWNFHTFFVALNPPIIFKNDINISQTTTPESNGSTASTKIPSDKEKHEKPMQSSFYSLLKNHQFSDAMELYQNSSKERVLLYRSTLNTYFKKRSLTHQEESIKELLEYIKIETENESSKRLLIDLYKKRKEYKESIKLITELIDSSSHEENEKLHQDLVDTSRLYIDTLQASKSFQQLEAFLERQIEYGVKAEFFIFNLAKYHVSMQSYDSAIKLLKEIEFDEKYGEKAKELLNKIITKKSINSEYLHKLSLTKNGSHFTIDVTIDDTPLTLLLDTGATLTMINEDKLSSLTLINENITLKTAGGDVPAQLQMAEKLTVGDIELENFKVTTSSFKQEKADGLLGMNFFEKFKFKIDQENAILYLSEK